MKQGLKRDYRSCTLYRHKNWREVGEGVGLYLRPDKKQTKSWREGGKLKIRKGIEFLPQTQFFWSQYLCNLIVQTFDISNLDYFIYNY